MNRMFGVAVIGLAACAGCVSVTGGGHPDSSGWADVFAKDLSNATCAKPGWAWNADGYLVPGTGETLFSNRDYGPFVLDCEYMLDATGNSGIFIYDTDHPKYKVEVQLLDDRHPKYVDEVPYQLTGALYGRLPPTKVAANGPGETNRMTITADGARIIVVVNGEKVVDADISKWTDPLVNPDGTRVPKWHEGFPALGTIPRHGRIGLQGVHGGAAARFKYIRIKEL